MALSTEESVPAVLTPGWVASAADYASSLAALFPRGLAWPRHPDSIVGQVIGGLAHCFSRSNTDLAALLEEADPRTAIALLDDWERVLDLPDGCTGEGASTIQGRRTAILSKLLMQGGQSRAAFLKLAETLGYQISIDEFRPFRVGFSRAGDPLIGIEGAYLWRVRIYAVPVLRFQAGSSQTGDPLAAGTASDLECLFRRLKPAHTTITFLYEV